MAEVRDHTVAISRIEGTLGDLSEMMASLLAERGQHGSLVRLIVE